MILKIATLAIAAFMYPQPDSAPQPAAAEPAIETAMPAAAAEGFHKNHNTGTNILHRPSGRTSSNLYTPAVAKAHTDAHSRALSSQKLFRK